MIGNHCDACTSSSQCIHSLQLNQTCWRDPAEVLIELPQKDIIDANATRILTCESDIGLLTTYLGDHHIEVRRPEDEIIELRIYSSYAELSPLILECQYEDCQVNLLCFYHS